MGLVEDGLYVLAEETSPPYALSATTTLDLSPKVLLGHNRFGHPSASITKMLLRHLQIPLPKFYPSHLPCQACDQAKAHNLPHPPTFSKSIGPFHLTFIDVWGPTHCLSIKGNRFYVSILDDYSKYIWLFPMSAKSQVPNIIIAFIHFVKNFFNSNIRAI